MGAISRLIQWCRVVSTSQDKGDFPVQQTQYKKKESYGTAWYPYGYHAVAPFDTLALMLSHQGTSATILPGSPRERILIENGEVIVYHPITKAKVHFKASGDIDIDAGTANINVTAGDININSTGDTTVTVGGNLRTLCGSTRFQNDAASDDLHLVLSDFLQEFTDTSSGARHNADWRAQTQAFKARVDALR